MVPLPFSVVKLVVERPLVRSGTKATAFYYAMHPLLKAEAEEARRVVAQTELVLAATRTRYLLGEASIRDVAAARGVRGRALKEADKSATACDSKPRSHF